MTQLMQPTGPVTPDCFEHRLPYRPCVATTPRSAWRGYAHPDQETMPDLRQLACCVWQLAEAYAASFIEPCGIAWVEKDTIGVYFPKETLEEVRQWIGNTPFVIAIQPLGDGWVAVIQYPLLERMPWLV